MLDRSAKRGDLKHLRIVSARTLERGRSVRILWYMLLALGVISILMSLLLLGFAALGFLGILADVSPNENRVLGIQAVSLGLPVLIGGVLLCALGLLARAWNHRRAATKTSATADEGGR